MNISRLAVIGAVIGVVAAILYLTYGLPQKLRLPVPVTVTLVHPTTSQQPQNIATSPSPGVSPEVAGVSSDPNNIVTNFYTSYYSCVKNHFDTQSLNSTQEDCPYSQFGLLSSDLAERLRQASDSDPVFCAQNLPDTVSVDNVVAPQENSRTVYITEKFGDDAKKITVDVLQENEEWEIQNIQCPGQ